MEEATAWASNDTMMFRQQQKQFGYVQPAPFNNVRMQADLVSFIDQEDPRRFRELLRLKGASPLAQFRLMSGLRGSRVLAKLFAKTLAHRYRLCACLCGASSLVALSAYVFLFFFGMALVAKAAFCVALAFLVSTAPLVFVFEHCVAPQRVTRINEFIDDYVPVEWFLKFFQAWRQALRPDRSGHAGSLYRTGDLVTCLHLACTMEAPSIVDQILSSENENALHVLDSAGRTPLQALQRQIGDVRRPHDYSVACKRILRLFKAHNWRRRRVFLMVYARMHCDALLGQSQPACNAAQSARVRGPAAATLAPSGCAAGASTSRALAGPMSSALQHELQALRLRFQLRTPCDRLSVLGLSTPLEKQNAVLVRAFLLSKELFELVVRFL